jgi:ATP-binding cassette subfamily F protein 3
MASSNKMKVGYFTQYQVEELDPHDTPMEHMSHLMKGATPAAVRAQLGRFGFSGDKAITKVGKLSGGERARLALALITRDAPHMLILDEPTNHLDVDAREALVQALNAYTGAVVLVSHDRHMLELTADRLVLVDDGTAKEFDGSLDDYIAFVLKGDSGKGDAASKADKKAGKKAAAEAKSNDAALRKTLREIEEQTAKFTKECAALDLAISDPTKAEPRFSRMSMGDLNKRRAEVQVKLDASEAKWLEASEALEGVAA